MEGSDLLSSRSGDYWLIQTHLLVFEYNPLIEPYPKIFDFDVLRTPPRSFCKAKFDIIHR